MSTRTRYASYGACNGVTVTSVLRSHRCGNIAEPLIAVTTHMKCDQSRHMWLLATFITNKEVIVHNLRARGIVQCYKPEVREFDSRYHSIFQLT
jgi:hypothetical protein